MNVFFLNKYIDDKYHGHEYGNIEVIIINTKTKEQIKFNNLIIHMISKHRYFHKISPETIIRILEIKPDITYEAEYFEKRTWRMSSSSTEKSNTDTNFLEALKKYSYDYNYSTNIDGKIIETKNNDNPSHIVLLYYDATNITYNNKILQKTIETSYLQNMSYGEFKFLLLNDKREHMKKSNENPTFDILYEIYSDEYIESTIESENIMIENYRETKKMFDNMKCYIIKLTNDRVDKLDIEIFGTKYESNNMHGTVDLDMNVELYAKLN